MKFKISSSLEYQVNSAGTLIFNIQALKAAQQTVLEETLSVKPAVLSRELSVTSGENRLIRLEIEEESRLKVSYQALVDTSYRLINFEELTDVPIAAMDTSVLPFLNPSRYCQSDKLYRLAYHKFGKIENAFLKVNAIVRWIHENVEYRCGSSNSQTSALETITEQAGVCRDFAHLGIALCRALTIPARYFASYAYQLKPSDFHACFEAFLGGRWIIFDATRLAPLNGMVKIGWGRDAADAAIANIFGDVTCTAISVGCSLEDTEFKAFYYDNEALEGLSYS